MIGKIVKWTAVLLGVLGGGLTIFLVFFFDFDELLNEQKDKYVPQIEAALGRKVEVGSVATQLFPVLGAELRDVKIQGQSPGEPPLMTLKSVSFQLEWWTAIKSAGTEVRLKSLILDGLDVYLVRNADGSLSYQDIIDRQGAPKETESEPLSPEARRFIEGLQLERVALVNGSFHLVDRTAGGAETQINDLEIAVEDVVLASPFEVGIRAAIFSQTRNFELRTRLGPLPIGQPDGVVRVEWIKLKTDGVDLAGITPYLGGALPVAIDSAKLTSELQIDDPLARSGRITSKGSIKVADLRLGGEPRGEAFTLAVTPNFDLQPAKGEIDLTGFTVAIDDMVLSAAGKGYVLARRPRFEGVEITTQGFDFDKLMARLPPIAAALPPGSALGGPFSLAVKASGDTEKQDFDLNFDFGGAKIMIPGALAKPAGTPLALVADASLAPDLLDLRALRLQAASLDLNVKGTVKDFAAPTLNLTGGTGRFAIDGLMRLLPNVRKAVPPDVKIAGQAAIDLRFVGNAQSLDGLVDLGIYDANLAVPGTTLQGTGTIKATAKGTPAALAIALDAALSGMTIQAGEAFKKPGGAPLTLVASGGMRGNTLDLGNFALRLGPLDVKGGGTVDLKSTAMNLRLDIGKFSFRELSALVPAVGEGLLGKSSFGGKLTFAGSPSVPSTVDVRLERFEFDADSTALSGNASVANLDAPQIRFAIAAPSFDLDKMFPPSDAPAETTKSAPDPIIKKIDARGSLNIGKGRAAEMDFKDFVAQVNMQNGVVRFDKLDFKAYDGTFSAAKSKFDVGAPVLEFDIDMKVQRVDVAKILTDQAKMPRSLSGRASTELRLKGKGDEWRTIRQTLIGDLTMGLQEGKLESLSIEDELFGKIQKKVPFIKLPQSTKGTSLKALAGTFSVSEGRMKLNRPLTMTTPQGPMSLNGSVGLDATLDLVGNIEIPVAVISKISGGKIKLTKPLPVALQIGGTLDAPKLSGIDSAALVAALLGGSAAGLAMEKLDAAKAEAERRAAELKAQAQAELNKAKAEAEKKANELKKKAEAEADKAKKKGEDAAKKAGDKAKKEAAKRLKGLF